MTTSAVAAAVPLYDRWASEYDELLGEAGFSHIWPSFQRACRRFDIRFAAAADSVAAAGCFSPR